MSGNTVNSNIFYGPLPFPGSWPYVFYDTFDMPPLQTYVFCDVFAISLSLSLCHLSLVTLSCSALPIAILSLCHLSLVTLSLCHLSFFTLPLVTLALVPCHNVTCHLSFGGHLATSCQKCSKRTSWNCLGAVWLLGARSAQNEPSEAIWEPFGHQMPEVFKMSLLKPSGSHLVTRCQNCSK